MKVGVFSAPRHIVVYFIQYWTSLQYNHICFAQKRVLFYQRNIDVFNGM